MAYLALIRHGKSEWNALGQWTGWKDIPLTEEGYIEASNAAKTLAEISFDEVYLSKLIRAKQTYEQIAKELNLNLPITENEALNERSYGDYTGKNKWQIKEEIGDEEFQKLRRSWDYPIPNGETMKDVYDRVAPYFESTILPKLQSGKNILIVAHNNSLRALEKLLDHLTNEQLSELEVGIGEVHLYTIDTDGKVTNKEIRNKNPLVGKI